MFDSKMLFRGTSFIRNCAPPLGSPYGPRHSPTVGSRGRAISHQRGNPVCVPSATRVDLARLKLLTADAESAVQRNSGLLKFLRARRSFISSPLRTP